MPQPFNVNADLGKYDDDLPVNREEGLLTILSKIYHYLYKNATSLEIDVVSLNGNVLEIESHDSVYRLEGK